MQAPQITDIQTLRHYLHLAMQLEHATVPPYLTALYSIKPGTNFDATGILRAVAVEEMLHLTLAANLLNAIGGTPRLTGPGFVPTYPAPLPDGETDFEVHLQAFSPDTIETFLKIERPKMAPDPDSRVVRRPLRREGSLLGAYPNDPELSFYSIGEFYRAIEDGFINLEETARGRNQTIFSGDSIRQVPADKYYSGGGRLFCVTDLDSARQAINEIIVQGEGEDRGIYGPEGELAHFYRFRQLERGRFYRKSDDPGQRSGTPPDPTGPALKIDWKAVYPIKTDAKLTDYQPNSEVAGAVLGFNAFYAQFLGLLEQAFNGQPDLLTKAVPMMFQIRDKANQIMRNPLGPGYVCNAAPTFEMPTGGAVA